MLKFICITVFVQKLEIFLTSLRFMKILIKFICTKTIQTWLEEGTINNGKEYIFESYT